MLKHITIATVLILCTLASLGCSTTASTNDFQRLLPNACVPLVSSKLNATLAAEWQPYLSSTHACPLVKIRGAKPDIVLVSIFIEDYYRDKPAGAMWENFPKPILFSYKGERVGELEELFPGEDVGEMVLTYGHWQGNIPGEIRMHIIHPGVAGDYDLPTLLWNKEKQRYVAQDMPAMNKKVR